MTYIRSLFAALLGIIVGAPLAFAADGRVEILSKASVSASAASGVTSAATTTTSVTVPGAKLGDACIASHSVDTTGILLGCSITATDTAKVYATNVTTNGVALSSGTMRVFLIRKGTK